MPAIVGAVLHLDPLIKDLAVILVAAGLVTILFQKLRQPVVLGYLVVGLIVGPYTPPFSLVTDLAGIKVWAELGVIFLMFSLGLEFNLDKVRRVGKTAGMAAVLKVAVMLFVGYGVGRLVGWNHSDSIYLGAILSISSTTIVIKAFEELGLKDRSFVEVAVGMLVVEDILGILMLVALSTFATAGAFSMLDMLWAAAKLGAVVTGWFLAGYVFLPRLIRKFSRYGSDETMTVAALGLCLALVVVAAWFGYSSALGAFVMGSILAESTEAGRIEKLIKSVRDVFVAIFFVSIGMLLDPAEIAANWQPILWITLLTLVSKVWVTEFSLRAAGEPVERARPVGFAFAQIGEFSFLIATLGLGLGVMRGSLYPIAVTVSVITTFCTPYLIRFSQRGY